MGKVFLGSGDDFDPDYPRVSDLDNFVEIGYAPDIQPEFEEEQLELPFPMTGKIAFESVELREGAYELLQEYMKEFEDNAT